MLKHVKKSVTKTTAMLLLPCAIASLLTGCPQQNDSNNRLWITDEDNKLGYINITTGELTVVGDMGISIKAIAFDQDGQLYGTTSAAAQIPELYSINKNTAEVTLIGTHEAVSGGTTYPAGAISFVDGTLYAVAGALFTIDTLDASTNNLGRSGDFYWTSGGDSAIYNGQLYSISEGVPNATIDDPDQLVTFNLETGEASHAIAFDLSYATGLAATASDLYVTKSTQVYRLNLNEDSTVGTTELLYDYAGQGMSGSWTATFENESNPNDSSSGGIGFGGIDFSDFSQ